MKFDYPQRSDDKYIIQMSKGNCSLANNKHCRARLMMVVLWRLAGSSIIASNMFSITEPFLFQNARTLKGCPKIAIFIAGSFLALHISYIFSSRLFSVLTKPMHDSVLYDLDQLLNADAKFVYLPAIETFSEKGKFE